MRNLILFICYWQNGIEWYIYIEALVVAPLSNNKKKKKNVAQSKQLSASTFIIEFFPLCIKTSNISALWLLYDVIDFHSIQAINISWLDMSFNQNRKHKNYFKKINNLLPFCLKRTLFAFPLSSLFSIFHIYQTLERR